MTDYFAVNESNVEAEVYKETTVNGYPVYLVKIKLLEIGTYISGVRVQKSIKRPEDGLWVQMPAMKFGQGYTKIIECSGDSPFLEIVTRRAQEAVEDYIGGKNAPFPTIKDEDTGKEVIDLDSIPF